MGTAGRAGERIHEFYNLIGDPQETRDLASSQPAIVRQLDGILDRQPASAPLPLRD
jgi:iduronate 2-sulfatase